MTEVSGLDRVPPWSELAEQAALGAMMRNREAIGDVEKLIGAGDFQRAAHQEIFKAILHLDNTPGKTADWVSVKEYLTGTGDIERCGGAPYIHTLNETAPAYMSAGSYAQTVLKYSVQRDMIASGQRITQMGWTETDDIDETIDRAHAEAEKIGGRRDSSGAAWMADQFWPAIATFTGPPPVYELTPPYDELRDIIPAYKPEQLVVIAARPSVGKTVLLGDHARWFAMKHQHCVAWFSCEMGSQEIMMRTLSAQATVDSDSLQKHALHDDELKRLNEAADAFAESRIRLDDLEAVSISYIRAELRRLIRTGNPAKVVLVDYIQLMTPPPGTKNRSREQEVSALAQGLKNLAKEFKVLVMVAAQLNRGPDQRTDKTPVLSDLRESGAIEQAADIVILLHRPDMHDAEVRVGEADLIVAKHRNGRRGTRTVVFQGRFGRFVDMAPGFNPPPAGDPRRLQSVS